MDLASEINRHIEWDESIENILSEIGDESQINAYMHKKAQAYYTTQNIKYQSYFWSNSNNVFLAIQPS